MSTHCNIAIANIDGSIDYIYCHFDGYPSYMVSTLIKHYDTEEKIRKLIALGNLSFIDKDTGYACAFHRDMKYSFFPARKMLANQNFDNMQQRYCYLFKDGEWYMNEYNNRTWLPVIINTED